MPVFYTKEANKSLDTEMRFDICDYMLNVQPINCTTIRAQVYEQLKSKIISAEIRPGEVVTVRGLAEEFGVSLMPVREALWQLESERAIVIESNKRIYVNRLTGPEVEDILRLRLVLESMAAVTACRQRADAVAETVRRYLEAMEASLGNQKAYMLANSQFHLGIYAQAGSPILLQTIRSLWARIEPYLVITSDEDYGRHAMGFHRGMFDALLQRDTRKMRKCLREDLSRAAKMIMEGLESKGRAGTGPLPISPSVTY
jgi:DNA-binding GntR family transcriptional regulator